MAYNVYHVNHDTGTDDTASGRGDSAGDPWATVEYALGTGITGDAVNGDKVYVTGDGGETLTQAIQISTFIADYGYNPLIIEGFGTTPGDHVARPTITISSTHHIDSLTGQSSVALLNLNIVTDTTTSLSWGVQLGNYAAVINCHFTRTSAGKKGHLFMQSGNITNCSFKDLGESLSNGCVQVRQSIVKSCVFVERDALTESTTGGSALRLDSSESHAIDCIFKMYDGRALMIDNKSYIYNCSFFIESAATNAHASVTESVNRLKFVWINNIFSGYNSVGAAALTHSGSNNSCLELINNTFYDCTARTDGNENPSIIDVGNEDVASDPFADAAGGDFTPQDVGSVREGSYPTSFPSI